MQFNYQYKINVQRYSLRILDTENSSISDVFYYYFFSKIEYKCGLGISSLSIS